MQDATAHRSLSKPILALAAAGAIAASGMICIAQQQPDQQGQARVVERTGPEVEVPANGQGGQIVVLFPQAAGGQGGNNGDVEVVLVESQMPAAQAAGAEGQSQQPTPTGREILFSSRDATDGLVRHTLDTSGNGRRMKVLARVNGQYVQAQQSGGTANVTVFTIARPQQQPQQQQQQQQQQAQDSAAQADPNAAQGAPEGAGGPEQQQQQPAQPQQPQTPAPAAVLILYAGSNAS